MKIYTSYFYQVRYFSPDMVPLSTALSDPKWYHAYLGKNHQFKDKNGVLNGLRFEAFKPGKSCSHLCTGPEKCNQDPSNCKFLKKYRDQLDQISIKNVIRTFKSIEPGLIKDLCPDAKEITFVFLVHEAPCNPCSERIVIQEWFRKNGYDVQEWHK